MKTGMTLKLGLVSLVLLLATTTVALSQDLKPIKLPDPDREGGMPLMKALSLRQTQREYSPEMLSPQELSNLLWAAFGINRVESGKRTAPSAMNWQETDIYVAMEQGLYLYNAADNVLEPVLAEDLRADTGLQPFVGLYMSPTIPGSPELPSRKRPSMRRPMWDS
jgi:hypothetical protein